MARKENEQTEVEATETETEAKGINYTGTANLKQLALAVAAFEIPDIGINDWLQATKRAIQETQHRNIPLADKIETANRELGELYQNGFQYENGKIKLDADGKPLWIDGFQEKVDALQAKLVAYRAQLKRKAKTAAEEAENDTANEETAD